MNFEKGNVIKDIINSLKGSENPIYILLESGREYCGAITEIGDHLIVVKQEGQRSYYDVYIQIDDISAIEVKERGE